MSYPLDLLHLIEEQCHIDVEKTKKPASLLTESAVSSTAADGRSTTCDGCNKVVQLKRSQLKKELLYGELSDESNEKHWIGVQHCPSCQAIVGISLCGQVWTVGECLQSSNKEMDGLIQVTTLGDRVVLYVLNQVTFQQEDASPGFHDVTFLCPGPAEFAKILWKKGQAIAFYTMKLKGSAYTCCSYMTYQLPVVDLIYVRRSFRRQGIASLLVADVMTSHLDEDVGFSEPISDAMLQVLGRYLSVHAERRDQVWEVSWTGQEGFRTNVWLLIRRLKREGQFK